MASVSPRARSVPSCAAASTAPRPRSTTSTSGCSTSCRAGSRSRPGRISQVAQEAGIDEAEVHRAGQAPARRADHPPGHADLRHPRARLLLDARRRQGRPREPVARGQRHQRAPRRLAQLPAQPRVQHLVHDRHRARLAARARRDPRSPRARPRAPSRSASCPRCKLFKIRMDLEMEGGTDALAKAVEVAPPAETEPQPYDEFDIEVIRATQGDMPVIPEPYAPAADKLGDPAGQAPRPPGAHAGAPAAAPRRRDPVPPPRRLQRQRDGRVEGARRADHGARPAHGRVPRHLALLPAAHLRGLAVLGLHHGPRPLQGGVRRDPRLDRRRRPGSPSAPRSTPRPSSRRSGCSTSPTSTAPGNASTPACERPAAATTRAQPSSTGGRSALLPGGVNSPVRAMRSIGRDPIFIASGEGATITDVDGNEYIDYVCSWGPLILGHAHPDVMAAVTEAAAARHDVRRPHRRRGHAGARRSPSGSRRVEMLRMTSSGTEATMSAIRLARAVTGREKVLKFAGAYHGHVDGLLAEAGSGLATQGIPASPGVPASAAAATDRSCPGTTRTRSPTTPRQLAAILRRAGAGQHGRRRRRADGFLELAAPRGPTRAARCSIFDEVITGFRVARGGAQERYGIDPDLTIMGKIIGGGLPGGGVRRSPRADGADRAGRRRLPGGDALRQSARHRRRPHDAAPAGRRRVRAAGGTTETLADGLRDAAAAAAATVQVQSRPGPAHRVLLRATRPRLRHRRRNATPRLRRLVPRAARPRRLPAGLAVRGVVPVAGAHRSDVQRTVEAAAEAFAEIGAAMRTARDGADALREALRDEGGTVASVLAEPDGRSGRSRPSRGRPRSRRPDRAPAAGSASTSSCSR